MVECVFVLFDMFVCVLCCFVVLLFVRFAELCLIHFCTLECVSIYLFACFCYVVCFCVLVVCLCLSECMFFFL